MNKKKLYNKIMEKCSIAVKKQLNETLSKMSWSSYQRIYNADQRYAIEKMLFRLDLLNPKYVTEKTDINQRTGEEYKYFSIDLNSMSTDEISIMLGNINWEHPLTFIDINDYDNESADICVPFLEDVSLFIEYETDFSVSGGDPGDYWTPPTGPDVEMSEFTINNAYLIDYSNNDRKIELNTDAKNYKGEDLLKILYGICESWTSICDNLIENYEIPEYDPPEYDD